MKTWSCASSKVEELVIKNLQLRAPNLFSVTAFVHNVQYTVFKSCTTKTLGSWLIEIAKLQTLSCKSSVDKSFFRIGLSFCSAFAA